MVVTTFSLTTILVLLFVGIVPTKATKCTRENLQNCQQISNDFECKYRQDLRDCLEKMDRNCTEDGLEVMVIDVLNWARLDGDQCTGLAEGECFHSAWMNCEKKLPSLFDKNGWEDKDGKKTYCDAYNKSMNSFKICLVDLKPKCTLEAATSMILRYIEWADVQLKNCKIY